MAMLEGWTLCPRCGNQLTHRANLVECERCGFLLYAHSAVTANALPEDDDGRLLLARRAFEPWRGCWDILGGFLGEGEHPLDGVRRELREETTLEFEPDSYFGAWTGDYFGEVALAMNMPRTASVRALTPATVASCDRASFDEFVRPLFADDDR